MRSVISAAAIACLLASPAAIGIESGPKPKRLPKPSNPRPLPDGTMTRQQRRAAERAAKKATRHD